MLAFDPLIAVRGVHFAATVLATGTVCFMVTVATPPLLRQRLVITVWIALALSIVTALAWLVLVAADIQDQTPIEICLHGGLWPVAGGTRFGHVTCLRLGVAVLLAVAMPFRAAQISQLVAAACLIGLLALVGHAGATPGTAGTIHLTSDLIHLLAAGAWLGGLPALAMTLGSAARGGAEPARLALVATRRFSTLGIICVGALVVTGGINSFELLSGPRDLISTNYGRVLLSKIVLFAVMILIASVNRYRLTPRLPAGTAMQALRRNALIEASLGFCILLLVGALGTMSPTAHLHTNAASAQSDAAFVHIHTEAVMADVTVNPGHNGNSTATIRLSREDSDNFAAQSVRLELAPRDGGTPPISRDAEQAADGNWHVGDIDIPRAGVWIATVTIGTEAALPLVLDAPLVIVQCSNECW